MGHLAKKIVLHRFRHCDQARAVFAKICKSSRAVFENFNSVNILLCIPEHSLRLVQNAKIATILFRILYGIMSHGKCKDFPVGRDCDAEKRM